MAPRRRKAKQKHRFSIFQARQRTCTRWRRETAGILTSGITFTARSVDADAEKERSEFEYKQDMGEQHAGMHAARLHVICVGDAIERYKDVVRAPPDRKAQ